MDDKKRYLFVKKVSVKRVWSSGYTIMRRHYEKELKIIEVQKGDYISEDDIIRYEDCYGRV